MGRPRKNPEAKIDANTELGVVERMARCGCTISQIAAVIGMRLKSAQRKYGDAIKNGHLHRNATLIQTQYQVATRGKGNPTMLIWLGKQYLGQKDKIETTRRDDPLKDLLKAFSVEADKAPDVPDAS